MQSGMKRKEFKVGMCPPEVASRMRSTDNARNVNGLATDALNSLLIASTYDGTINVRLYFQLMMLMLNAK